MIVRTPKQLSSSPTESGFTIVECLVAIIIVSVLLVAIAPVLAISVATRVQARRVELATQAARDYIDGVSSGKVALPGASRLLTDIGAERRTFALGPAPPATIALSNCNQSTGTDYPYCQNPTGASASVFSLYCVDLDGDGGCTSGNPRDMIVQAFRSRTTTAPADDDGSKGYLLGVRVYRADAFDGGSALQKTAKENGEVGKAAATYAGGLGNQKVPLVELTTEITPRGTDFNSLCRRLSADPDTGTGCP